MTAINVHTECPIIVPNVTLHTSCDAPRAIIASCERSPHSARKTSTNTSTNIGDSNRTNRLRTGVSTLVRSLTLRCSTGSSLSVVVRNPDTLAALLSPSFSCVSFPLIPSPCFSS
ncbi:hypothetical protein AX774_g4046 [Zancudomyces culisetae]|uniref:Uncharacterized protein n=1 Tax=Zancudomyces culisetae TaxID=1213189 RepID=A0A1R1PND2_ZANCU|nr:hypothetical protein AX774_g4046 [Zancudomyces culisetae]|eukprot:OMH82477.1 hypothetical protein AX774_g4046 [Zancudomyces culisetae]